MDIKVDNSLKVRPILTNCECTCIDYLPEDDLNIPNTVTLTVLVLKIF